MKRHHEELIGILNVEMPSGTLGLSLHCSCNETHCCHNNTLPQGNANISPMCEAPGTSSPFLEASALTTMRPPARHHRM